MSTPSLLPTNIRDETIDGITYHIQGELVPALIVEVRQGAIYFEHHVLLWKSPRLGVGLKKISGAFKRMMAGMPIFITATNGQGQIALSRDGAGQIAAVHLQQGQSLEVREHQFLAATENMAYDFTLVKGISNMFFGNSGYFVDRFTSKSGTGVVWLHGYGNVFEINLQPDQQIDVEPGAWIYKDPTVRMETKIQRLTAGLLGAQGQLTVNRFSGPGRLGIQSMSIYMPAQN
jgi:YD repeat-containing protein